MKTLLGALQVAAGAALFVAGSLAGQPEIALAGIGLVASGIGTILSKGPLHGFATTQKNPIAPWNVIYGRARIGGVLLFDNTFGDNDKYRDLVIVLAAHPCESVDALLFDTQRVQIGAHNTSFTPLQQDVSIFSISRAGSVVTVVLHNDIPLLQEGDYITVHDNHPVSNLFNGKFPVANVAHTPGSPGAVTFTYLAGGPATGSITSGMVRTAWPDYGKKIYMEVMLGTQTLGQTFVGMTSGTPADGDAGHLIQNPVNPWTADCSCVGHTVVFLRLHYNDTIFANGLPQISFLVRGKNDIYDPRTSPATTAYTENAALCIADHLSNTKWGFKAPYGTKIPLPELIAAANICDQAVALAWPPTSPALTEPRYACNGHFDLSMKRGEVLLNLLTSCAGRYTYIGGQYRIYPGAWAGISDTITGNSIYQIAAGSFHWKPKATITQLFNGVKGTFVSPANKWMSSDFPRYAQDATHGYSWGTAPQHDQNLDDDGGDRRWYDIQLPFTISAATAQRIAKIELLRRRFQGQGTFDLNMAGYKFTPPDVIALDLATFGWTGQELEVHASRLKMVMETDGGVQVPRLGVEIDVQETDSSIYAWSVGEELSPSGYQQAITPDTSTPAPPTNVLLSSVNGRIEIDWIAPADAYVLNGGHIEVQYQLVASPEGLWISLAKMDPGITTANIFGLQIGDAYNVRVRSVNAAGVPSAWVTGSPADSSPLTPGPITVQPPVIWVPDYETPLAGDPLFSAKGFGILQDYPAGADGYPMPEIQIFGDPPPINLGLVVQVRRALVTGIFAQEIASDAVSVSPVDGLHGVISFGGSGGTTNEFVGRILSKLANPLADQGTVPIQDFTVTANDTAGNFTVTPDPSGWVKAGDLLTLCTAPTAADGTSFTDSKFNNLYNPGLTISGNKGNFALVVAGTGAGQPAQTVVDNTATKVTVSPGWSVIPDSTSIIHLVERIPQLVLPITEFDSGSSRIGNLPVLNYSRQVIRAEVYVADSFGQMGPIESVPFRSLYMWGSQGTESVAS
ncbi:MAG TPA: hypothetical protein VNH83_21355 [Bryobacteraceae bacterium]|nr:hypothetical protein [Bryobacteraceae bacterium]